MRKKAKTQTTLHDEGLQLAGWVLRAMIYLRTTGVYFPRQSSRLKSEIDRYMHAHRGSVGTNFIFALLAVQTVSETACGGNIHLVPIGVGAIFDFFEISTIKNVSYREKSEIFLKDFLFNVDEPLPYCGNIHVHPIRYVEGIRIADILTKLQTDHGPQNPTFRLDCRVFHLELMNDNTASWQKITNTDLARICTASLRLAVLFLLHSFDILTNMKKYVIILFAAVSLIAAGCTKTTTEPVIENASQNAQDVQNTQTQTTNTASGITMAQVQAANIETKCWTVIRGEVYDLTEWIATHPGGSPAILGLCGKDGTQAFTGKHAGMAQQEAQLAKFKIGTLAK